MSVPLKRNHSPETVDDCDAKRTRFKFRKCAIMMMYCGVGYYGMQVNHGFRTIESELIKALGKVELIPEDCIGDPKKANFQRASKTDRNVSALGQVCSIKLLEPRMEACGDQLESKINEALPSDIRILEVMRATKKFNCKDQADYRIYEYVCPSFAFAPSSFLPNADTLSLTNPSAIPFPSVMDLTNLISYRMDSDRLQLVNHYLQAYKGTRNYHNFTSKRDANDRSCNRFMRELKCDVPFMYNDMEFVKITIKGQSFMLHQIRKMLGLVMAITRGHISETIFTRAFSKDFCPVPRAPGLGLLLNRVMCENYNKKFAASPLHKSIDFDRHMDTIDEFEKNFIYPYIYKMETEEKSMISWLTNLFIHDFNQTERHRSPPKNSQEKEAQSSTLPGTAIVHVIDNFDGNSRSPSPPPPATFSTDQPSDSKSHATA